MAGPFRGFVFVMDASTLGALEFSPLVLDVYIVHTEGRRRATVLHPVTCITATEYNLNIRLAFAHRLYI